MERYINSIIYNIVYYYGSMYISKETSEFIDSWMEAIIIETSAEYFTEKYEDSE